MTGTERLGCGVEELERLGGRGWAHRADEGCVYVCVLDGVISTKSVPYDTHSHGLCLDSLSFLSV